MEISRATLSIFSVSTILTSFIVYGYKTEPTSPPRAHLHRMQALTSFKDVASPSTAVYHVTSYGADPTGKQDSTDAILKAVSDALGGPTNGRLTDGIVNLGGARVDLDGGNYLITRPIRLPVTGKGNFVIHGGSLTAANNFPDNGYLIDLSPADSPNHNSEYNYEFVTLRDLLLDSNFRGGGIQISNSLRTSIDNCYVTRFNTTGIAANGGHETYIRNSYLGQIPTAGGDHREREFSGTAIALHGNDNAVTDVVIFSAAIGILVTGQANAISGVHCYNKAKGFGGIGISLRTPGLTQTRIINSYFDFTGIVAEDPVQLSVTNSFFLGDAYVLFKSVEGVVNGVNVVDNMFSGSGKNVDIVQLDETGGSFERVDQVVVDRNNVKGMRVRSTVARGGVQGNGNSNLWAVDFSSVLVFPNLIRQVQYSFVSSDGSFPAHVLRNVSENRVVIQAEKAVNASVYVTVDQGAGFSSS
ncbi:pectin lyase-like superfamily protein [Striga asiatica]|uniref:Pectin lyase-like superfamily protein n=1 Tax=Striga asiatica TaxID=4170 RepID=A0A5A7PJV5_STRAF|nr:pectin lyase-like superfamily protein [Striga asiatica]